MTNGRTSVGNWFESVKNPAPLVPRKKNRASIPRHCWSVNHQPPPNRAPPWSVWPNDPPNTGWLATTLNAPVFGSTTVPGPVATSTGSWALRVHHSRYSALTHQRLAQPIPCSRSKALAPGGQSGESMFGVGHGTPGVTGGTTVGKSGSPTTAGGPAMIRPDGSRIYTTHDGGHGVAVWDVHDRRPIAPEYWCQSSVSICPTVPAT